jgi:peptidoglycan/xylan/chitin deacetylase (PgdA/CDA1 family)
VLEELRAWAGAEPVARPTHRVLSRAELLALARSRVVEIGAHSRRHPRLASLAPEAQREEVHGSKHALEALLGATVASFAYPFGKSGDYSPDTVALVREAGFACACTNVAGAVGRSASRFELPRMLVHDCSGEEFERRLDGWLRRARG